MGGDVPVDDEVPTVTRKLQDDTPAQSFRGAHRGRVCVCVHRGDCMRVYMSACICTVLKKNYRVGMAN